MTFLGDMAYEEARARARSCRGNGDHQGDRLWSKVAMRIAQRTGYEIGLKAADHYEREADPHERERARYLEEVARSTRAILSVMAEIARGKNTETALHNVGAHVRNALDLAPLNAAAASAGAEVCRAAAQLAAEEKQSADLVDEGKYPPALEAAGDAVERLREALVRAKKR